MTARLVQICRHPIKSHGREALASVRLLAGQAMPYDRHWAVAHEAARLHPGWNPCANFARGAKAPLLMAIDCRLDEALSRITLNHPDRGEIRFSPDRPEDQARFLDWVMPLNPPDRALPARIMKADVAMTDSDYPSVSILNLASLRAVEARLGMTLSPHRFRANLWVEGCEAWDEWQMIGQRLRIGDALLEIRERITRCRATMVDVETGRVDADTLGALEAGWGHRDFGVYAVVLEGGEIALNDEVALK